MTNPKGSEPAPAEPNFGNRTIFTGDNLHLLRGLNTDSVDLIYLDPPFNSKKQWNAPIGSQAAGAAFKDTWSRADIADYTYDQLRTTAPGLLAVILAAREAGGNPTMNYLLMMAPRLIELRRILKPAGSIYLHCDPTESHTLKMTMDIIFGRDNYRNEIVWSYGLGGSSPRCFSKKHDTILFYTNGDEHTFHKPQIPATSQMMKGKTKGATDVWDIPSLNNMAKERVGYPTQKPTALLERIIAASSNEGDIVLDPFCGCATAAIAAEHLGRQWLGMDLSPIAAELVRDRLQDQLGLPAELAIHRTDTPQRTDLGDLPHYRTHKRALFGTQEGRCNGCGTDFGYDNLTVDHIIPRKHGGTDHPENLQLLCAACNSRKGTGTMSQLMERILQRRTR